MYLLFMYCFEKNNLDIFDVKCITIIIGVINYIILNDNINLLPI